MLASGSNWNHTVAAEDPDPEYYVDAAYNDEREELFSGLASRIGTTINWLLFISGDDHINEIYHVDLGGGRMAPEFLSSPFTRNSLLRNDRDIEGERVASFATKGNSGKRGFATSTINTSRSTLGNWRATVRYYQEAAAAMYESHSYVVSNGEFKPV